MQSDLVWLIKHTVSSMLRPLYQDVSSLLQTTHGTKKMWSYIAGGLKIKVISHIKLPPGTKSSGLIIKGGLKIEGCKIEGIL